jgi:signal transduction histidine kinase
MERAQKYHVWPSGAKQWMRIGISIVILALIALSAIKAIKTTIGLPDGRPFLELIGTSLIYTTVIVISQLFTGELAHKFYPLHRRMAGLIHVIIQSFSALISFWLAQKAEILIMGECSIPTSVLAVISGVSFALSLIGNTGYYLFYFARRTKAAEQSAIQSELKALRAQINPHFLFNTLNSIAALIRIDPDEAETVTEYLADLFRYSLRSSRHPMVSLEEEIHSIDLYLSIEKARFREKLHTDIQVPGELYKAGLPSLLLQPLVENSIKHGAAVHDGVFRIHVGARLEKGMIIMQIADSGRGFDPTIAASYFKKGTGLDNVRSRLVLAFGSAAMMKLDRMGITLEFPFKEFSKDNITTSISDDYKFPGNK